VPYVGSAWADDDDSVYCTFLETYTFPNLRLSGICRFP
jgi:hypothetical protein